MSRCFCKSADDMKSLKKKNFLIEEINDFKSHRKHRV